MHKHFLALTKRLQLNWRGNIYFDFTWQVA